ncbi:MAG: FAD-binding oxidoreductase [Oligoflexia bacterium]|nr:FAD-binding oxidoreductase [Oligoflexia bacterium]
MTQNTSALAAHFKDVLPAQRILTSAQDLEYYGKDSSKQFVPHAGVILLPESEDEVRSIVAACRKNKLALVPSGGRTGYSGGATAQNGEVVLSLSRMSKVLEVRTSDQTLRCQAGATTEAVRQAAAAAGLCYPVDFASRGSSQIGGNIATNAGGIRVIRYGNTRDWVLGLRAVSGSGEVLNLNGALYKNQTGYDLRGLLIGSEGTLAIVTEATLKLTTPPGESFLALAALDDPQRTLEILAALRLGGWVVNVFEYFERDALELVTDVQQIRKPFRDVHASYALVEVDAGHKHQMLAFQEFWAELLGRGIVSDVVCAENLTQAQELMALRERISESINRRHVPHKNDISVPVPAIPEFLREFRARYKQRFAGYATITFGHIGDGNLHVNVLKPQQQSAEDFFACCSELDECLFGIVQKYSGSISAEHGVGLLKRNYLGYSRSAIEIEMMRSIKRTFDPDGILNPGKLI